MTMTLLEEVHGPVKKITATWATASSSSGGVQATTTNPYNGKLERLVTIPGGSALAPSASYDITVSDQDSTDTLMGGGANRKAASTEQVAAASLGVVANDKLTFKVANAGSSHAGTIYLYIR